MLQINYPGLVNQIGALFRLQGGSCHNKPRALQLPRWIEWKAYSAQNPDQKCRCSALVCASATGKGVFHTGPLQRKQTCRMLLHYQEKVAPTVILLPLDVNKQTRMPLSMVQWYTGTNVQTRASTFRYNTKQTADGRILVGLALLISRKSQKGVTEPCVLAQWLSC